MQFCVKSSSDPAQQHPETKYYSPAVLPKSPLAFFLNGPHKLTFIRTPCPDGGVFKGTSLQAGVLDPANPRQIC